MSAPQVVSARFRLPDDSDTELFVGDTVGRLWSADLQLNDPGVSEMHAYLSLRDGKLKLLPLRGALRLYGLAVDEVVLEPGIEIELAPGVVVVVAAVAVPRSVAALAVDGEPQPLVGAVGMLDADGTLVAAGTGDGLARVWSAGESWYLQQPGGPVVALMPGDAHQVGEHLVALTTVAIERAGTPDTEGMGAHHHLDVVARFDSVLIHREGRPVVRFSGIPARLLTVLAELGGPTHWEVAAREVWPRLKQRDALRRRWDRGLWSLRQKLQAAGIRGDLVSTAAGQAELVLEPGDRCTVDG